jgi:hypothetical protein
MQFKAFIYVIMCYNIFVSSVARPLNKQRIIKANMISLIQDNRD